MRVGINARLLASPNTRGWNRYTVNLIRGLSEAGATPVLFSDRPLHQSHLDTIGSKVNEVHQAEPMNYLRWEQFWLSSQISRHNIDIFHSPYNFGLPAFSACPRVLTLHDAIHELEERRQAGLRDRISPAFWKTGLYYTVARRRADRVITVSGFSRHELVSRLGVPESRVVVTHEAADERFFNTATAAQHAIIRAKYNLPENYIFYIGGWEGRKNIGFLLEAFAQAKLSNLKLVLAGGSGAAKSAVRELVAALNIEDRTVLLDWVSDEHLPALYSLATCFVYPSRYEGFGLQLCEAMAAGCATLAANSTSLPEVLGDGGWTFDLANTHQLSSMLERLENDPQALEDLRARARRRAENFSWSKTARETLRVYDAAIKEARPC